jgi:hypothetical protein
MTAARERLRALLSAPIERRTLLRGAAVAGVVCRYIACVAKSAAHACGRPIVSSSPLSAASSLATLGRLSS